MGSNQIRYYAAKVLAQVSQNLLLAALFIAAGTSSNAAIGLSSVFAAQLLAAILFGALGGAVCDRYGPARGLVIGAAARLLPVLLGVYLLQTGAKEAVWIVAFLYSAGSQIFTPAEMALVKSVQNDAPGRVHSLLVAFQYGGQGLGMLVLGPVLYFLGGPLAIIIGAATGFAVLLAITFVLETGLRGTAATLTQRAKDAFNFRETLRLFTDHEVARYAIVVLAFQVIVARGIIVTLPLYLEKDMGLGNDALAFLVAPGVVGLVAGLVWSSRNVTLARAGSVMRASLLGMVVAVFALAVLDYGLAAFAQYSHVPPIARLEASMNTTFVVALPAAFLLGATISSGLISARVALTETAPAGQQARVFAVQGLVTDSFVVLPLLLAGVGTAFAGARLTLAAIGLLTVAAVVLLELPRFARRANLPAIEAQTDTAGAA